MAPLIPFNLGLTLTMRDFKLASDPYYDSHLLHRVIGIQNLRMVFHFIAKMFNTFRWSVWGQQIWALIGAVAALITMVTLLGRFNNSPIFSEMGVTLNTIISVLSVTVKAAVAFILSECIAQWKWILYAREERLMIDFDRLDGAARGPLGSLRVLLRTKGA